MPGTRRSSVSTLSSLDNGNPHSDDADDEHIIIDLNSSKLARSHLIARQSTTSDFQDALQEDYEELRITASVASDISDKTARYSVRLVTSPPSEQNRKAESEATQHWLLVIKSANMIRAHIYKSDTSKPSLYHSKHSALVKATEHNLI